MLEHGKDFECNGETYVYTEGTPPFIHTWVSTNAKVVELGEDNYRTHVHTWAVISNAEKVPSILSKLARERALDLGQRTLFGEINGFTYLLGKDPVVLRYKDDADDENVGTVTRIEARVCGGHLVCAEYYAQIGGDPELMLSAVTSVYEHSSPSEALKVSLDKIRVASQMMDRYGTYPGKCYYEYAHLLVRTILGDDTSIEAYTHKPL